MESIRLPLPAKRRRLSSFSSLENQKNLLEVQIREQQTNDEENVREIKKFYEAEMCEARRLLNAQAEESARYDSYVRLISYSRNTIFRENSSFYRLYKIRRLYLEWI